MKKRILAVILCMPVLTSLVAGCGKEASDDIITITKSDEAKTYEEETQANCGDKEFLSADNFDLVVEKYSNRGEQVLPECEVQNPLDSFEFEGSNVYTLTPEGYENIILYIHGGAWVFEINSSHVAFCDDLATRLNAKVYMPLYPLTPDSTCEETCSFIEDIYKEVLKENKTVYVMGVSAG